jgi:hypothetical protein
MIARTPAGWSTISGSLLSIIVSFDAGELVTSCLVAAAGTIVSYAVSRMLKALFERGRK